MHWRWRGHASKACTFACDVSIDTCNTTNDHEWGQETVHQDRYPLACTLAHYLVRTPARDRMPLVNTKYTGRAGETRASK